jgi:hypothetical protein
VAELRLNGYELLLRKKHCEGDKSTNSTSKLKVMLVLRHISPMQAYNLIGMEAFNYGDSTSDTLDATYSRPSLDHSVQPQHNIGAIA